MKLSRHCELKRLMKDASPSVDPPLCQLKPVSTPSTISKEQIFENCLTASNPQHTSLSPSKPRWSSPGATSSWPPAAPRGAKASRTAPGAEWSEVERSGAEEATGGEKMTIWTNLFSGEKKKEPQINKTNCTSV